MFWTLILLSTHVAPGNQNRLKCLLMRFSLKPECATRFYKPKLNNTNAVITVKALFIDSKWHPKLVEFWEKKRKLLCVSNSFKNQHKLRISCSCSISNYCNNIKLLSLFSSDIIVNSMTSLLMHNVAHSTKHSLRLKTNNQTLKKFLSLVFSWVKVVKNWTSF